MLMRELLNQVSLLVADLRQLFLQQRDELARWLFASSSGQLLFKQLKIALGLKALLLTHPAQIVPTRRFRFNLFSSSLSAS